MIRIEELGTFPARPDSEFEWEDLLLRLEIMPRALKVELENVDGGVAQPLLAEIVARETEVQAYLETVAIGGAAGSGRGAEGAGEDVAEAPVAVAPGAGSYGGDVDRFVRLRGRNFAMLQRRGIDVWNWMIQVAPGREATVFQLLSLLAMGDVEILARLREARVPADRTC